MEINLLDSWYAIEVITVQKDRICKIWGGRGWGEGSKLENSKYERYITLGLANPYLSRLGMCKLT